MVSKQVAYIFIFPLGTSCGSFRAPIGLLIQKMYPKSSRNGDEIAKVGLGKVTSTSFGEGSALVNDLRDRLEKKTEELNELRNEFAEYKMDMAEKLAGQYRQAVKDLNGLPASPRTNKSD